MKKGIMLLCDKKRSHKETHCVKSHNFSEDIYFYHSVLHIPSFSTSIKFDRKKNHKFISDNNCSTVIAAVFW